MMSADILVVAEHARGRLADITFELLGKGRELARTLGGRVVVALLGHEVRGLTADLGACDVVRLADRAELREFTPEAYTAILHDAVKEHAPRLVLMGSTSSGLDVLSCLAAQSGFSCLDNCVRLEARDATLTATCQIYGGKLFAEVRLPEQTTLIAMVPGTCGAEAGMLAGNPEVRELGLPAALTAPRIRFRGWIEPPAGDVDITTVPILVAVGRGIQNADNLALAEGLAEALGGAVCASRPVIDQGWLPLTRQVGKSGMTVKPKAYLAFGISGAPEHLEGMKQAELIVAVNTDAKAPIFGVAHYGAVADAIDLLPLVAEEVRKAAVKKGS